MQPQPAVQQPEQFQAAKVPPTPVEAADSIESQLKKIVDKFWWMGRASRPRRHFIWAQAQLFSQGIHFFNYDWIQGKFQEWNPDDQDMYTPVPLVQYVAENTAAEYSKAKPRIIPHIESDKQESKLVANALQDVSDAVFDKFYLGDAESRQREAKLAPLRDIVIVLLEYDQQAGQEMQVPVYEGQRVAMGQASCPDCQAMHNADQLPAAQQASGVGDSQCPACGSVNLDTSGVSNMTRIVQNGTQPVRQGEVKRTVIDGFQWDTHERRAGIDDSPYNRFDEILFIEEAEAIYPEIKIEGRAMLGGPNIGYNGLHILRQIETLVSNTGGLDQSKPDYHTGYLGSYLDDSRCMRSRIFLKPVAYSKVIVGNENGCQLPGTQYVLPKGSNLKDVYPQGMVIHLVNDKIVRCESIARYRISAYKYSVPGCGMFGVGLAPIVSLNKLYDELTSYQSQWALMASLGILLYDERLGKFKNKPGTGYAVPQEAMPYDKPLDNLVSWKTAGPMPPAVEALRQSVKNDLASISLARNPNAEGMAPASIGTATGVNYQNEVANTLTAPKLELFAGNVAKVTQGYVELEAAFNQFPRCFSSRRFGKSVTRYFDFLQIPQGVRFIVEEDSHQPRTSDDRKRDTMAFIQVGGGQGRLAPHIEENLAKEFRQPTGMDDYDQWSFKAQNCFDRMKQAETTLQQTDPQMLAQAASELVAKGIPPSPATLLIHVAKAEPQRFDNSPMYQRFIVQEIYLSDEWDDLSPMMQQAVDAWYQMHDAAVGMKMQEEAQKQVAATAPVRKAQADQENETRQASSDSERQQVDSEGQRTAMQMLHEHEQTKATAKESQAQRKHDSSEAAKDRAHDEKMAQVERAKVVKK